ncbi:MAG TPA: hypothetical protein VI819_03675 [Patescibacteria group bacterium]|nr:hypothetical protein [Patescibacteria group bacterium]
MFNTFKRLKTLGFILIIIIFAIVLLIATLSRRSQKNIKPNLNPPAIPKPYTETLPIQEIQESFDLPSQLPLIEIRFIPISRDYVNKVKDNLGMESEVKTTNDYNDGLKYYATSETQSLWITPKTGQVNFYSVTQTVSTEVLSESVYNDLAERFLSEKLDIKSKVFIPSEIKYLKINPGDSDSGYISGSKDDFNFVEVDFGFSEPKYLPYLYTPIVPASFVILSKNGEVSKADVTAINSINIIDNVDLKNMEEIKETLSDASLIGVDGVYMSVSDINPNDLKNISITKIQVVYLIDENITPVLQPVYLLEGNIELTGTDAKKALMYLPAVKY